jgi:AcrR family transcriptional regulator
VTGASIDSRVGTLTEAGTGDATGGASDRATAGTRRRLLQAGGRLFAEHGFHAVSVRNIVAEADANLGAINYHFGSKLALFEAIFAEGATRIADMRLRLLAQCREGTDRPPLLEQILAAYLAPGLIFDRDGAEISEFQRIRARIVTEDSELAHKLLRRHFQQTTRLFLEKLQLALPGVPRELLIWRYQTMIATVVYAGSSWGTIHSAPDGVTGGADDSQALDYLVPLMAAMFRTRAQDQPTDARSIVAALMEE